MADLDADILALAGEESDEESANEQQQQQQPPQQQIQQQQTQQTQQAEELESGEESEDDESSRQQVKLATSKVKSRRDNEAGSQQSADMSESEASMPDDEMESTKFPIEGRFRSEKDREHIMGLPEIEREQILAERADEVAQEDEQRRLRALLRSYGGKKRKASESDLRGARKPTRVKTQKDKSLDELKRKREERGALKAGKVSKTRRSFSSDPDADGDSEAEWEDRRRDKTPEERPITVKDFEHIKIGYQNFAMVCFYPHFAETMVGCFVRLSTGSDPRNKVYRMARIEEIVERHPYAMESAAGNGRKFITTQHVVASFGKMKKEWPFINCSQGAFTQRELDDYLEALRAANMSPPKLSHLLSKNTDLFSLIGHKFTEKELGDKVSMSGVLQERYREHKKAALLKQKEEAERDDDSVTAARLEQQISSVMTDPLNLRYGTSVPHTATQSPVKKAGETTQQQRLGQLNRERAKADQQRIRNAQINETRRIPKHLGAGERGQSPMVRDGTPKPAGANGLSRGATPVNGIATVKDDDAHLEGVRMVDGKPVHNIFSATDDLELPRPEWTFNYVEYSNKYLGSRSMHHLAYDEQGRAKTKLPRQMCDDEIIARMDIDLDIPIDIEY